MSGIRVLKYGIFDSAQAFSGLKKTAPREVTCFEFEYIIKADGVSHVDGESFPLRAGLFLLRRPGQVSMSVLGFKCYYLHADVPPEDPAFALLSAVPNFFPITGKETYRPLFESFVAHLLQNGYDPACRFCRAKWLELLYYIEKDAQTNRAHTEMGIRENGSVEKALDYLEEHAGERVTLADLAALTSYSPNHFHRIFSSVMGKTPQAYLLSLRLEKAAALLNGTGLTAGEIAGRCGFSTQSYFSLVFRRAYGISPAEYRKAAARRYGNG